MSFAHEQVLEVNTLISLLRSNSLSVATPAQLQTCLPPLWFPIWVYTKHFPIIQRTGNCLSCFLESKPWEIQSVDHSSCSQCAVWYAANPGSKALRSNLWNLLHLFHKVTLNLFNLLHHYLWHPHLMHWVDNWRRRFIRQLSQLILRRPV